MKRVICLAVVLLLCSSMVFPVFAAENEFVPSISYKDHPEVVPTPEGYPAMLCDDEGMLIDNISEGCLVITPVSQVETSRDIPEDARVILRDVYKQLSEGSMKLPYENDADKMVIRDLIDASLICNDGHKEKLAEEGVHIVITFDLGVGPDVDVVVMTYIDGKWMPIESVVNNGDGTVTCTFEDICPIAFSVLGDHVTPPSKTGDVAGSRLVLWMTLMVVSAGVLVAIVVGRRKFIR